MRILVFRVGRKLRIIPAAAILILVVSVLVANRSGVAVIYSSNRALPIYSVEQDGKKAAITFDCAWGADDIPEILDTLKRENVKATFFLVGDWADKFPEATRRIAQDGHDLGNHSDTHPHMGGMSRERIISEITGCSSRLQKFSDRKIELFRAPYGEYDDQVVKTAEVLGCYTIQWNVDSLDWKPGISKSEILNRIMSKTAPGAILLFHNDTAHTAKLLTEVVQWLKREGYQLVPVSEMIYRENYTIDFEGRQRKKQ